MGATKSQELYQDGETTNLNDYSNKKSNKNFKDAIFRSTMSLKQNQYFRSLRFRKTNKRDKKESDDKYNINVDKEPIKKSKSYSAISRHRVNTERILPTNSAGIRKSFSDDKLAETVSLESMKRIKKPIVSQNENETKIPENVNVYRSNYQQSNKMPKITMHQLKSKSLSSFSKPNSSLESSRLEDSLIKEEVEMEKKNKENDGLIEDLKKQVESLKKQLHNIEQHDTQVISELNDKIEQLSKLNNVI